MKTIFKFICPHCGKKQYESTSSQQISGTLGIITPFILLPIVIWFEFSVGTAFMVVIVVGVLTLGLYPFMLKLSNKKEYFI